MSRKGLARVASLYGQVERVRLVELQLAAAGVLEVERALAAAAEDQVARRAEGRGALALGESVHWRMAESACDAAERSADTIEALRVARETLRAEAGTQYRASRLQTERVARVVADLKAIERLREDKIEQANADDRFAARLCWPRMKVG